MQTLNLKKSTHKLAANKLQEADLRALAQSEGIPEFMLRLARDLRVKISKEQVIPKYRHD